MLCTASPPLHSYGCAGAVWDIWQEKDIPVLRKYLTEHMGEFVHRGKRLQPDMVRVRSRLLVLEYMSPCCV